MKKYQKSFIYVAPLIKPFFDCSKDKTKPAHTRQEIGLYEKLSFEGIKKGNNYVNK